MAKIAKRVRSNREGIDRNKNYSLDEAVELLTAHQREVRRDHRDLDESRH